MRSRLFILTIFTVLISLQFTGYGQTPTDCILIEGTDVVLYLDQRWTKEEQINAIKQFDMTDLSLDSLWRFHVVGRYAKDGWKVKQVTDNAVKIYKAIGDLTGKFGQGDESYAVNKFDEGIRNQTKADFGYNDLRNYAVQKLPSGKIRFFLSGNKNASRVYLSGTFNEWSTKKTTMLKVDSGWISDIALNPGKHVYKYIVDGRWKIDPNNFNTEDDYNGGLNSVYFVCNYTFKLNGYLSAKNVVLSGSFNKWNERRIHLNKSKRGWSLPVYLKDGTYSYKFLVDRNWITDPGNPNKRDDGAGNINSFISIGDPITFELEGYISAKEICVAGNFNGWNNRELKMSHVGNTWKIQHVLSPGNYEYKFVVDGKWLVDPDNPYVCGRGDQTNSLLAVKPNHVFLLKGYSNSLDVRISGNFNDWNQQGYKMKKVKDGWMIDLYLPPGKCQYKFIVDGKWMLDPGNSIWEQNEYGTGNSLLWIPFDGTR